MVVILALVADREDCYFLGILYFKENDITRRPKRDEKFPQKRAFRINFSATHWKVRKCGDPLFDCPVSSLRRMFVLAKEMSI